MVSIFAAIQDTSRFNILQVPSCKFLRVDIKQVFFSLNVFATVKTCQFHGCILIQGGTEKTYLRLEAFKVQTPLVIRAPEQCRPKFSQRFLPILLSTDNQNRASKLSHI